MKRFILNQKHRSNQPANLRLGFTIVEILIVIGVIGILATITVVAYNGTQQKARIVSLQSDLSNSDASLALSYTQNGTYPANLASAGLTASPGTTYQYAYTAADNSYCLTATNGSTTYVISTANPTPTVGVCPVASGNGGVVTTLAGSGVAGFADGTGTSAQFNEPFGVAVDSSGTVYVAEYTNARIRKITSAGVVTTLAGSGVAGFADGPGTSAQFNAPTGVAVDSSGTVYVAEYVNARIRKITPAGVVSTLAGSGVAGFADGPGTSAQFNGPWNVAVDSGGNVYVADYANQRIRKVTPAGVVSTLAGSGVAGFADGTGTSAQFNYPQDVAVDSSGTVYVSDQSNHRIRKITPAGVVTTLAGSGIGGFADGPGTSAQFNFPRGVAVDSGGTVYVADMNSNRIRKITPAGVVSTLAGSGVAGFADGTGTSAQFNQPRGVAVDSGGNVYVGDYANYRIRKIQ